MKEEQHRARDANRSSRGGGHSGGGGEFSISIGMSQPSFFLSNSIGRTGTFER